MKILVKYIQTVTIFEHSGTKLYPRYSREERK